MMKSPTDWMPAVRHRRSQNAGVVYALVDEVTAVVDALMRISSRTEYEFGSPAAKFFGNALVRQCSADDLGGMLRPGPEQVNGSGHFAKAPTNPLAINPIALTTSQQAFPRTVGRQTENEHTHWQSSVAVTDCFWDPQSTLSG